MKDEDILQKLNGAHYIVRYQKDLENIHYNQHIILIEPQLKYEKLYGDLMIFNYLFVKNAFDLKKNCVYDKNGIFVKFDIFKQLVLKPNFWFKNIFNHSTLEDCEYCLVLPE